MWAVAAVIAAVIAILMHAFGWGTGKVDVLLFELLALGFIAVHLAWLAHPYPWRRDPQQPPRP
jgi:hypothetical protein